MSEKTALVYYQVWTDGKLTSHGNITSTYKSDKAMSIPDEWRDWISGKFGFDTKNIFITGVFQL